MFALSRLEGLRSLDLGDLASNLCDYDLQSLSLSLTCLQSLTLSSCKALSQTGILSLCTMVSLHTLELSAFLCSVDLCALSCLTALNNLNLNWGNSIQSFGFLSSLTSLRILSLKYCFELSDDHVHTLASLTQLEQLFLTACRLLSDACLLSLPLSLQMLDLVHVPLTHSGLQEVTRLTTLQTLAITSLCVENVDMAAILRALPKLRLKIWHVRE